MWRPAEHTDEENLRWCWLRAVEWGAWPLFLSQFFAPILLVLIPWYIVVSGILVANVAWAFVRYRFVSTDLAGLPVAFVVILKWPVSIGSAACLAWQHDYPIAVLAFFWPLAVPLLGVVTPVNVGRIQSVMMKQLGYEPDKTFEEQNARDKGA